MSDAPPPDPRLDRYQPLVRALHVVLVAVGVLAVVASFAPERFAEPLAVVLLGLLVTAPLARVIWLVRRWFTRGDVRFALVGLGVLAVIAAGTGLAALLA